MTKPSKKAPGADKSSDKMLRKLEKTIKSREGDDPNVSYVARMFHRGRNKIAQKIGEEATEFVIAALRQSDKHVIDEAADLLFHTIVLLVDRGLSIDDVISELARRDGISGIAEKASRPDKNGRSTLAAKKAERKLPTVKEPIKPTKPAKASKKA